ncbi:hemerythrin domain-containing protein [Streptomyces sp. PmtA]|uniref:hemerythrin domain-containing protein n=1 Tax=Streptomyces sp. PmtA TaxID=3074275 RepID=UPI003FCC29D4
MGTTSMGEAIKAVHDAFRRELALIRREIAESGPRLGAQLRINCLTLCQGLHNHHTGEDTALFPFLAGRYEELAPVMDRLREEHGKIAALLDELRRVVAADGAEPGLVQAEVGRLSDELEAHLVYEEEQLIPVLDAAGA